ncbi:MAG: LPS export ABC transporter periplasmic protein LptC [Pseudomonadota bacterium]
MNTRGWLALIILVGTALASWYLRQDRDEDSSPQEITSRSSSGYYLLNARIRGTDASGATQYVIDAAEVTQSELGAPIAMSEVRVLYGNETPSGWLIESQTATLEDEQKQLSFVGDVRVTWTSAVDGESMTMTTDALTFDAVANIVQTNETVSFDMGMGRLLATGMRASLTNDTVELRSNVRGQFKP